MEQPPKEEREGGNGLDGVGLNGAVCRDRACCVARGDLEGSGAGCIAQEDTAWTLPGVFPGADGAEVSRHGHDLVAGDDETFVGGVEVTQLIAIASRHRRVGGATNELRREAGAKDTIAIEIFAQAHFLCVKI